MAPSSWSQARCGVVWLEESAAAVPASHVSPPPSQLLGNYNVELAYQHHKGSHRKKQGYMYKGKLSSPTFYPTTQLSTTKHARGRNLLETGDMEFDIPGRPTVKPTASVRCDSSTHWCPASVCHLRPDVLRPGSPTEGHHRGSLAAHQPRPPCRKNNTSLAAPPASITLLETQSRIPRDPKTPASTTPAALTRVEPS